MKPLPILSLMAVLLASASTGAAQPIAYVVDAAASTLAYTGHHPAHTWTGTSRQVSGTILLDAERPAGAQVELTVPVESFDSGNGSRDSNMLDVVEVEAYPDVRFVSDGLDVERWEPADGGHAGRWRVRGHLTFHGQRRPVAVLVDVRVSGTRLEASARFAVALSDYGVRRPRLLFVPIRDAVELEVHLVGEAR